MSNIINQKTVYYCTIEESSIIDNGFEAICPICQKINILQLEDPKAKTLKMKVIQKCGHLGVISENMKYDWIVSFREETKMRELE
jgi:hypothetical protein